MRSMAKPREAGERFERDYIMRKTKRVNVLVCTEKVFRIKGTIRGKAPEVARLMYISSLFWLPLLW
jgi:hypothetical protein